MADVNGHPWTPRKVRSSTTGANLNPDTSSSVRSAIYNEALATGGFWMEILRFFAKRYSRAARIGVIEMSDTRSADGGAQ
jgi:hypothetical protein